jgi:hypothetical protein
MSIENGKITNNHKNVKFLLIFFLSVSIFLLPMIILSFITGFSEKINWAQQGIDIKQGFGLSLMELLF